MGNVSGVKAKTFGPVTTASAVNVAADQNVALVGAVGTFVLVVANPGSQGLGNNHVAVLQMVSGQNLTAINFTITGTDAAGTVGATETITGPNATTKPSLTQWESITSVTVDAAIAGGNTCSLGWAASVGQGFIFPGRTRVRGFSGISLAATAGTVVVSNGAISANVAAPLISTVATSLLQIPTAALLASIDPYISDDGVLFDNGAYINTNLGTQAITVYYDG